jgi:hypothetical protein
MPDFYLTLAGFVENFQNTFHLPKDVIFYSDWEVGLTSLTILGDFKSQLSVKQREIQIKSSKKTTWTKLYLPIIAFDSIYSFIDVINQLFILAPAPLTNIVNISLITSTKLVLIQVKEDYDLLFSDELSKIIGIDKGLIIEKEFSYYFPFQIDFTPHFAFNLNIIEDSIINNYFSKNLRTINFKNNWSNIAFKEEFSNVHYHRVATKQFSALKIKISQIIGIVFNSDVLEISAVLHFREKE